MCKFANDTWQGWGQVRGAGGAGTFSARMVAISGMSNGDAQILAVGNDGDAYRMTRLANTTFTDWAAVPGANGVSAFSARRVAITGESTGSVYLVGTGGCPLRSDADMRMCHPDGAGGWHIRVVLYSGLLTKPEVNRRISCGSIKPRW